MESPLKKEKPPKGRKYPLEANNREYLVLTFSHVFPRLIKAMTEGQDGSL